MSKSGIRQHGVHFFKKSAVHAALALPLKSGYMRNRPRAAVLL